MTNRHFSRTLERPSPADFRWHAAARYTISNADVADVDIRVAIIRLFFPIATVLSCASTLQ